MNNKRIPSSATTTPSAHRQSHRLVGDRLLATLPSGHGIASLRRS
jgi:hypothetical protein